MTTAKAKSLVSGSGAAASRYMRFIQAHDDSLEMGTPDGERVHVRPGNGFMLYDQDGGRKVSPSQLALRLFSHEVGNTHLDTLQAEMPWVRVKSLRNNGVCFRLEKVTTSYPKGAKDDRNYSYKERENMRKEKQDSRNVVKGMGRTVIQNLGEKAPVLYLIPEGYEPDNQPEIPAENVFDQVKKLYREVYKEGRLVTFTFSSVSGENAICEDVLRAPDKEADYQPHEKYTFLAPLHPDEFDVWADKVQAGQAPALQRNTTLTEALPKIVDAGGSWKVIPVYKMSFANKIRKHFDNRSGRLNKTIQEDNELATKFYKKGETNGGWNTSDILKKDREGDLENLSNRSILGRIGAFHACFQPMEVLEAMDSYSKTPYIDDAMIAQPSNRPVYGILFDRESINQWHEGERKKHPISWANFEHLSDEAGAQTLQTSQKQGKPAEEVAAQPQQGRQPSSSVSQDPQVTNEYDDLNLDAVDESVAF